MTVVSRLHPDHGFGAVTDQLIKQSQHGLNSSTVSARSRLLLQQNRSCYA